MRTLLVGMLAMGLFVGLMGCQEPGQKTGTSPKIESGKAIEKAPEKGPEKGKAPEKAAPAKAVAPKGPSVPPVAGKAAEGKFVLRVDCGKGGGAYTDKNGIAWSPDGAYNANRKYGYETAPGVGDVASHPMEALDALYATERWGMTDYRVDAPSGKYTVRLHFAEIYDLIAAPGVRVFTISLQGKPMIEKFDITKEAGGFGKVVIKEFKGVEVTDGKLIIGFTKITEFPTIQALEVIGE
jgi:hypothetical protein